MKNNSSNNLEPLIWTGEQIINATTSIPSYELPLLHILFSAKGLLAIVTNIEDSGVNLLTVLLENNKTISCHIIVCFYTNSLTSQQTLKELNKLEKQYKARLKIKVLLINNREDILASIYCINNAENKALLSLGSFFTDFTDFNDYISDKNNLKRTNLIFEPEHNLLEVFYRWFEQIELENTISLDKALWAIFNRSVFLEQDKQHNSHENVYIDNSNQEKINNVYDISISNKDEDGKQISKINEISKNDDQNNLSIIRRMGFYRPEPFVLEIDRIYKLGEIVTLAKKNRVLPLDVPIKAEWLGLTSTEKVGEITQEIKYRIAAVDKESLKKIESKRNEVRYLINNFTFSMGEYLHWIPLNAKSMFEQELDRINNESKEIINNIVGNNIVEYLNERKNKIKDDAKTIKQRFLKNIEEQEQFSFIEAKQKLFIDDIAIDKILDEMSKRLKKAKETKFVPTVIYNKISFNHKENKWASSWTQVLHFLTSIAEFARKDTYEKFLKQTPSVIEEKYLQAMNVCDDFMFKLKKEKDFVERRKEALLKLESLLKPELEKQSNLFNLFETDEDGCKELFETDEDRCKELFHLIIHNN